MKTQEKWDLKCQSTYTRLRLRPQWPWVQRVVALTQEVAKTNCLFLQFFVDAYCPFLSFLPIGLLASNLLLQK